MLTLYIKDGCPYCIRVLGSLKNIGVAFETKNIADDAVAGELVKRGGKRQVPYLVDPERNVEMYESEDIVKYLEDHYEETAK
ncbi:MAG TPA: glutathione S-transferase N-terminal domain-containing protein [Candidatus Paceibacterota bacterium]|nr:glutathione S-transferase N-terminal domain-containing protein [Candidatus Paceibacterota bacterium]